MQYSVIKRKPYHLTMFFIQYIVPILRMFIQLLMKYAMQNDQITLKTKTTLV